MEQAGKINVYVCEKCGNDMITINAVEGVTPFMVGCRADWPAGECDGMAQSQFYRVNQKLSPGWEWYRPEGTDLDEREARHPGTKDHVERGGLVLRRLTGVRRSELLGSPRFA